MLSNQFRSFYGEGILSTNLILYPLYMNKPRQQQMKWEGGKRQVYKILIGKEWGFDEIYPNFFFTYLVRWCAVCYSPRADTTMAASPEAASNTTDTNNWRAAIKSIAVTLNLDFIERLHQMGTPVTWIQSLFTITWETVGWSGGPEKILLRSHNDERGNDKNVENK